MFFYRRLVARQWLLWPFFCVVTNPRHSKFYCCVSDIWLRSWVLVCKKNQSLETTWLRIVGIEINPRFGGGYPLSYLAGGNFPKWLIEEHLLHKEVSYFEDWKDNLLMLRYDAEVLIENYEG